MPAEGELHVWRVDLGLSAGCEGAALAPLSPFERDDLARFGRPELRRRALVARAAQRAILAGYLDVAPRELRFETGALGKPRLAVDPRVGPAPLRFNLSHSFERALLVVAREAPVGIDVEHLREVRQIEALARRYLAPAEQAGLRALPDADRSTAFLRLWVGKEALAKSTGEGLQFGLRRIALRLEAPGSAQGATRVRTIDDEPAAAGWTLRALVEPDGYVAAVAAPRAGMRVRRLDFEPPWQGTASA